MEAARGPVLKEKVTSASSLQGAGAQTRVRGGQLDLKGVQVRREARGDGWGTGSRAPG